MSPRRPDFRSQYSYRVIRIRTRTIGDNPDAIDSHQYAFLEWRKADVPLRVFIFAFPKCSAPGVAVLHASSDSHCQVGQIYLKLSAYENDNSPIKKFDKPLVCAACILADPARPHLRVVCACAGGPSGLS